MNYLRNCYLLLSLLTLSCISSQIFAQSPYVGSNGPLKQLKYVFTYLNNNKKPVLHVSLEFKSSPEEKTILELPSHVGGADELYKNITDITVIGARIEKTTKPSEIELSHSPNQNIILNYNVKQGWDGPLTDFQNFLAPIFQKKYFQFTGNSVLIYPKSYKTENKLALLLYWQMPNGWKIANSYLENNKHKHQKIIANLGDVLNSLFISGDYRFYNISVKGGTISTAIHGKWPFQEKEFSKTVTKIINNERVFWNDYNFPRFLVSLIPVKIDKQGMTGTGMTNAFATALKSNYSLNYPVWYLISHETFHTWNNPGIFDAADENQVYYYWFSEGFTDYYANLLNLRMGLITLPDYIKQYNKTIVDYYSSPVNSSTIEQVKANFWKDFDMQRLPYQQGAILASNWDTQIKRTTHNHQSLDDLIRAFILFVKEHSKLTPDKMNNIAKKYKKEKLIDDIHNIYAGHLVTPDGDSLGSCVYQTNKMLARYNPGFDVNTSKIKHTIISLNPESKAFIAGLRNGQKLISIEEHPLDISQVMKITIKDGHQIKIIKFYPYNGELKSIPQFLLDQTKWATQPDQCLSWFK